MSVVVARDVAMSGEATDCLSVHVRGSLRCRFSVCQVVSMLGAALGCMSGVARSCLYAIVRGSQKLSVCHQGWPEVVCLSGVATGCLYVSGGHRLSVCWWWPQVVCMLVVATGCPQVVLSLIHI